MDLAALSLLVIVAAYMRRYAAHHSDIIGAETLQPEVVTLVDGKICATEASYSLYMDFAVAT